MDCFPPGYCEYLGVMKRGHKYLVVVVVVEQGNDVVHPFQTPTYRVCGGVDVYTGVLLVFILQ